MHQKAAMCEICGADIYVDVAHTGGFLAIVERAAQEHLASHPTPIVEQFLLRKHLDELAPEVRPLAVKQVYAELRELWGDGDRRGVYSIDEVLGSMPMYRLWCNANRCNWEKCRHQPA